MGGGVYCCSLLTAPLPTSSKNVGLSDYHVSALNIPHGAESQEVIDLENYAYQNRIRRLPALRFARIPKLGQPYWNRVPEPKGNNSPDSEK
ncbi:unnamed protein product [Orchesella dallaii]|uniref:Uncharacterized protein n=1 Tax=Orchesella dallaii TaxID=48710 RepID=A0ABP1Q857_9HEXA